MKHLNGQPITYPTACRDCKAPVFFHSNGYGDGVIFDSLGWPWPIHFCYLTRVAGPSPGYKPYMLAKYGKPALHSRSSPRLQPAVHARKPKTAPVQQPAKVDRNIVKCDPAHQRTARMIVSGFVHAVHPGRKVGKLAPSGTVAHGEFVKAIGGTTYTQVTIVDTNFLSYTMMIPVADIDLSEGTLVQAEIQRVKAVQHWFFVCRSLAELHLQ